MIRLKFVISPLVNRDSYNLIKNKNLEVYNMTEAIEREVELKREDTKPIEAGENEEKPQEEKIKKRKKGFWDYFTRYSPYFFLGFPA